LEEVKEEQELAISCSQVLRTPPLVSSAFFSAPAPTHEKAVGLNWFEHAAIQAYLSASKETMVGGELDIRLDLINVAKSFGLLIRIEELIPSSLKVIALNPAMNIENGSLSLNGMRLEPLKIESLKINAQATEQGTITLNPKVVFVDDSGTFKICRPKPVHVTVKPAVTFEFKVKSADIVFSFLASSFSEDVKNKTPLDSCGWRSLVDVMKKGHVPRSSVYKVGGGRASAVIELEKQGLVETKIYSGERGRGGNILKLRICCEREDVKRYLREHSFIGK
jgi:hypothetical protein